MSSTAILIVIALVVAGVAAYMLLRPASNIPDTTLPGLGTGDPAMASKGGNIGDSLKSAFDEAFPWFSHGVTVSTGK